MFTISLNNIGEVSKDKRNRSPWNDTTVLSDLQWFCLAKWAYLDKLKVTLPTSGK